MTGGRSAVSPGARALTGGRGGPLIVVPPTPPPWPLMVFFHGAGGDAQQGLPMLQDVADERGFLVLLPSSRGSTWDLLSGQLGRDVEPLDAALHAVFENHDVTGVAFSGFSDGASYALSIGLANGDLGDAVVAYSPGFLAPPEQVGAPRVWLCHGTTDTVLPVDRCGRRVARTLDDAGYDVHYEEFTGAHVVRPDLVRQSVDWWLGPAEPAARG